MQVTRFFLSLSLVTRHSSLLMTSSNVYIGTILDGFIARKDGDIGWLMKFADEGSIEAYNEFIANIDVMVIGRGTFEISFMR